MNPSESVSHMKGLALRAGAVAARLSSLSALTSAAWFLLSALIVLINPLPDALDLAAVAGIAGLVVVILSVTASIVLLLTQHLSEHYPRVLLLEVRDLGPWVRPLGGQVLAVIFIVAAGVVQPSRSSGLAALILLVMVLVQTGERFNRVLDIFDASALTAQIGSRWVRRFESHGATAANLKLAADPLLGLAESAAAANDPAVVEVSLSELAKVVGLYVSRNMTATWGDVALQGVLNRLGELPQRVAGVLPVTVLPSVAEGLGAIGCATGGRASPFANDADDVTPRIMQMLRDIVATSARQPNSTAPWVASTAMFKVAGAAIKAGKLATSSYTIKLSDGLIRSAPPGGEHVTGPSLFGLLQIGFDYARSVDSLMAAEYSSEIIQLFRSIHESSPQVSLRHLVLALESTNLATLYLAFVDAGAGNRRSKRAIDLASRWERLAEVCWLLCLDIARPSAKQDVIVMNDAMDCATLALVGELKRPPDEATDRRRFGRCWKALAAQVQALAGTAVSSSETFTELVLATYVCSKANRADAEDLRGLILEWLNEVSTNDQRYRHGVDATARLLGASAVGHDDFEMARAVVKAVGRQPDLRGSKALHVPEEDLFSSGHFGLTFFITPVRRGIEPIDLGDAHDSLENRRKLLDLERKSRPTERKRRQGSDR